MGRRSFVRQSAAAAALAGVISGTRAVAQKSATPAGNQVSLREKFFGCIAGCHIGSAMGAPVEGWPWERIEEKYGTLDRFVSYSAYGSGWAREPGTTEDGVERQKLMITAIIEKQDRVNAEDVRKIWVRDIKPESAGKVSEPFEADLLAMAKTPIPARDLGRYCDYSGLVSLSRSCHPIGLINAGDVQGAIEDVYEVGQLYQTTNSRGIQWAAVTVVGIAAATKAGATVDGVLGAIFDNCDKVDKRFVKFGNVLREIESGLKLTADCKDFREMRKAFDKRYSGAGIPYAQSYANEVVTKAVCVFKMVKGNLKDAIIASVNMGRDTDCLTAVAGGISGALSGAASLPESWITQCDYATTKNIYTNSQRTLREHSDGLYNAFKARLRKMKAFVNEMDIA
jgi:ADP-ribosylglycohydrolase